jgi:membrane fusion protein, multidrug efflux system
MTMASETADIRVAHPQGGSRIRVRGAGLKKAALAMAVIAGVGGAAWYGNDYWTTGRFLVTTDDAYVAAHSVLISPKVSGYIAAVLVGDNAHVTAGQVIARIDPRDYQTALARAQANVASADANIATLRRQIAEQKLAVEQAQQTVAADRAALVYSQQNYGRYTALARDGFGPVQQAQQAAADIREKQATLTRDTTGVEAARQRVRIYRAQLVEAKAALAQRQAAGRQATLNLGYTTITAPFDGTVGDKTTQVGQYVEAGTPLMALVPMKHVYVTANYMETQLTDVRTGQPVAINVDTYPGTVVHGYVASLSPASGQDFALLPPDNATGNFTKVVQRIPVKIEIDPHDPLAGRLRPGMSVEPTIDTKPLDGASHTGLARNRLKARANG